MIQRFDFSKPLKKFSRRIRGTWQAFFLPGVVMYAAALFHNFYFKPPPPVMMTPFLRNLDIASYLIAIVLTVIVFNLKRKYFSRRFSRDIVDKALKRTPDADVEQLLTRVFNELQKKMPIVWMLGLLLIIEGVVFYMVTSLTGNMNIYFMIGAFSLLINYPRSEMFENLALYVVEEKKIYQQQANREEANDTDGEI